MSARDFPAALIERCSRAAADDDPRILAVSHSWTDVVMGMLTPDELGETIIAVLRESGHAEMVAALKEARHYASIRFETPLLAIIDAALRKAGAQ